jgi:hypothetical protein
MMNASAMKLPSASVDTPDKPLADGAAHGRDAAHAHQHRAHQVVGGVFDAGESLPSGNCA